MSLRKNRLTDVTSTYIIFSVDTKDTAKEIGRTNDLTEAKKLADNNPTAYVYSKDSRVVYSTR